MDMHLVLKSGTPLINDRSIVLSDGHNISTLRPCVVSSTQGAKGTWSTATIVSARCEQCPIHIPFALSCISGHEWIIRQQDTVGDLKMIWYRQYGTVYRIGGCFGVRFSSCHDCRFPEAFSSHSKMCWRSATRRPCSIYSTDRDIVFQRQGTPSE